MGGGESSESEKDGGCIKDKFTMRTRTKFAELHKYNTFAHTYDCTSKYEKLVICKKVIMIIAIKK